MTGHDVVDGARRRATPPRSARCEILGERLGIGIANAINTFDPLEVVIGGGVSRGRRPPARPGARRRPPPRRARAPARKTELRLARHGPRAGVLGAALIAAQEWAEEQGKSSGAEVAASQDGGS